MSAEKPHRRSSGKNLILILTLALGITAYLGRSEDQINYNGATGGEINLEGIYYNRGELNSCPEILRTTSNFYTSVDLKGNPLNPFTASGIPFRPEVEYGAATWFYPLGSIIKVTNLANNRSLEVRVTDRRPNRVSYPTVGLDLYERTYLDLGGAINSSGGGSIEVEVRLYRVAKKDQMQVLRQFNSLNKTQSPSQITQTSKVAVQKGML